MQTTRTIASLLSCMLVSGITYDPRLNTRSPGERALFGQYLGEDCMFGSTNIFPYEGPQDEEEDRIQALEIATAVKKVFPKPTFVGDLSE